MDGVHHQHIWKEQGESVNICQGGQDCYAEDIEGLEKWLTGTL